MSKKERIQYLILTSIMFGVAFLIYGFMSVQLQNEIEIPFSPMVCFGVYGIAGGIMLSGLVSGIILFAKYIKNKTIFFKVICVILFPITVSLVCFTGIFLLIPYFIYNIIQIKKV